VFDYREASLSAADRALCDYAVKLTLAPSSVGPSDVERLREVGFSDQQITIVVQVIGYFNYITRVAEGLGAAREEWMTLSPDDWRRQKGGNYEA
jgi:uncharacterized peroxidase-related enzyme